jgi:hypothetical protein
VVVEPEGNGDHGWKAHVGQKTADKHRSRFKKKVMKLSQTKRAAVDTIGTAPSFDTSRLIFPARKTKEKKNQKTTTSITQKD